MKRFVVVAALIGVGVLAGCAGTGKSRSTMTEGPFRCTAKDSFGNAWSWTAYHKEMALANAFDMCRYRSTDIASCKASISSCVPVAKIPDHLDALSDFGSAQ